MGSSVLSADRDTRLNGLTSLQKNQFSGGIFQLFHPDQMSQKNCFNRIDLLIGQLLQLVKLNELALSLFHLRSLKKPFAYLKTCQKKLANILVLIVMKKNQSYSSNWSSQKGSCECKNGEQQS